MTLQLPVTQRLCSNMYVTAKTKVQPFLLFQDNNAEEAMKFYVSLIPGSEILDVARYGKGQPGKEGTVMKAAFSIAGQTVLCTDSIAKHDFTFTPAISLFVTCESEAQIEQLAQALSDGGKTYMPLGEYGFSRKFAWVGDRYGVTWQLNLE